MSSYSFNNRKGSKSQQQRTRRMQIEALEDRTLLSAAPVYDYADLREMYSELPISDKANYIDVSDLTVENLRAAIDQASQTAKDDVIVVHTLLSDNVIDFNDSSLIFDVDSDLFGSITLVGYGDAMLTLFSTQENVVIVNSGEVYFGGIAFQALQSEGQLYDISNLVVVSEDATVNFSRTMDIIEDATRPATCSFFALDGSDPELDSYYNTALAASGSSHSFTLKAQIGNTTKKVYITGLTEKDGNALKTWQYLTSGGGKDAYYKSTTLIDAEKSGIEDVPKAYKDDNLCWAAAASNALWYTGWANPSNGFYSEDDVFHYFYTYFKNEASRAHHAYEWFLDGKYSIIDLPALKQNGGGNVYSTMNCSSYYGDSTVNSVKKVDELTTKLKKDYGITLSIGYYPSGTRKGGHAITAWGYMYDTDYATTDSRHYLALYIGDSDNDGFSNYSWTNAPNKINRVDISWNSSKGMYNLTNYSTGYYYLDAYQWLKPYNQTTITVPSFDVTLTTNGYAHVNIGKVGNANNYVVKYWPKSSSSSQAKEWSFSHDGECIIPVTSGLTYCFRVKAVNTNLDVESAYSSTKEATPTQRLSTPTLTVNKNGVKSVEITIGNVANANNGYTVQYSTDKNDFSKAETVTFTKAGKQTITKNITADTTYYFRVKANASGVYPPSTYSAVQSVTLNSTQLPTPTLGVSVTGSNSVSVTVGSVENASGYKLQYSTDKYFSFDVTETTVRAGTSTLGDLKANTVYYFRVKAIGKGEFADSGYCNPIEKQINPTPLDTPTLEVVSTTYNTITVMVGESLNASGYTLQYSTSKSFTESTTCYKSVNPGSNTIDKFLDEPLASNTTYYLRVMAYGEGEFSNSKYTNPALTATTNKRTLDTPTLRVNATGTNSVNVTIDGVDNASLYTLEFATNEDFYNAEKNSLAAGSYNISGLQTNTTYYFRVYANASGNYSNSNYSETIVVDPSQFNNNDFNNVRSFLEQTDGSGQKNGTKINASYDPNDPSTWTGVTIENINGVMRITKINWYNKNLAGRLDVTQCTALKSLNCSSNNLTSLNVTGCKSLESLSCSYNDLTSLNVSGCTALSTLNCYSNELKTLDVSNHKNLTELDCDYNSLTSLNVSGCTSLSTLFCASNKLTTLTVTDCLALKDLACDNNELKSLNVSKNTALESLYCYDNQLTALVVSKNTMLVNLDCAHNNLSSLNVAQNSALTYLNCDNNQLSSLNVMNNPALESLSCENNQLTELNLSKNTALVRLHCDYNNLSELNVANNTALELLYCTHNQLTELDISNHQALLQLNCRDNDLYSLTVSGCTAMTSLNCCFNNLNELDVASCTSLVSLKCYTNNLTALNVSSNKELAELLCFSNKLTALDLSNNSLLDTLECDHNRLTSLDLSKNPELLWVSCTNNQFSTLDISGCPKLDGLYCWNRNLTTIYLNPAVESTTISLLGIGTEGSEESPCWTFKNASGTVLDSNGTEFEYRSTMSGSLPITAVYGNNIQTVRLVKTTRTALTSPTVTIGSKTFDSIAVTVNSVSNASGYMLQYSTDPNFGYDIHAKSVNAGTTTISGLEANTTYYFRAMAFGVGNYRSSNYGSKKSANTLTAKLDAPTLTITKKNSDSVIVKVNDVENAIGYKIQYAENSSFSGANTLTYGSNNTTLTLNGLSSNKTYYVRAMALSSGDYSDSDYCETVVVSTTKLKLNTPDLMVSAKDSSLVSVYVGTVTNASGYKLEFSKNSDFSDASSFNVTPGNINIDGLNEDSTYYFRVASKGSGDFIDSDYGTVVINPELSSGAVNVTATGTKLNVQFPAEANEQFTVILKGTDNTGKGSEVLAVKNVKAAAKNILNGVYTYNYTGKANYTYKVYVISGKYTANDFKLVQGNVPENILVGVKTISVLPAPAFIAKPGAATPNSITFQLKNGQPVEDLSSLKFRAKFDGDSVAADYTVNGNQLVSANRSYAITLNNDGSVTISGLRMYTKQTFQVAQTGKNTISAYSSNLTISTTREQMPAPTNVAAANNGSAAVVTWKGRTGTTYTIAYSYTNAAGTIVNKTVTTNATVNYNLNGSYTVSNLLSNTKYTFKVSANKTSVYDPSVFVESNTITTPTVIPAPVLKSVGSTESTLTIQVTNWNKMGDALQEVNAGGSGGTFTVKNGTQTLATFVYRNGAWVNTTAGSTSAMNVLNNQNLVEITIAGLSPNTPYSLIAEASSNVVNDNINTVNLATSKTLSAKTAITAHRPVTNLTVKNPTLSSLDVSWTPGAQQTQFIVTAVSNTDGKTITKTVSGSSATLTGLKSNTSYTIKVVVKADKNGSESAPTSQTAKTAEGFDLRNVIQLEGNHFTLDFGVDMTKYSGRLDFTVTGSGQAYVNVYDNIWRWVSDSLKTTSCSLFFGKDAYTMAIAYRDANPNAKILILENNYTINTLEVTTVRANYTFNVVWNFGSTATGANLDFNFTTDPGVKYDVSGAAKLTGGILTDNLTDTKYFAGAGKSLSLHFKN